MKTVTTSTRSRPNRVTFVPAPVGCKHFIKRLPHLSLVLSEQAVKSSSQSEQTAQGRSVLLGSVAHFEKMEGQAIYEAGHTAARQEVEAKSN